MQQTVHTWRTIVLRFFLLTDDRTEDLKNFSSPMSFLLPITMETKQYYRSHDLVTWPRQPLTPTCQSFPSSWERSEACLWRIVVTPDNQVSQLCRCPRRSHSPPGSCLTPTQTTWHHWPHPWPHPPGHRKIGKWQDLVLGGVVVSVATLSSSVET